MANQTIELVSSQDSPTGVSGRRVDGKFEPLASTVRPVSPITTEQIAGEAKALEVPELAPDTAVSGELARFEAGTDAFTAEQEARTQQLGEATGQSFSDYIGALSETRGAEELQAEAFAAEGGVDDIQRELDDISQQLLGEQHRLRRELETLEKNPQGLFGGALQSEMQRVERESLKEQADLSIIQMGIQGRFDSAKAIADRAVAIQFQRDQRNLDIAREIYEVNKELFTKQEQREFELKQADRERALNTEREDELALSDVKLTAMQMAQINGAPSDVLNAIQKAESPEDVMRVGGRWGSVDILDRQLKQAQLNNLNKKPDRLRSTKVIEQGGNKILIDSQTGETIMEFGKTDVSTSELQSAMVASKIQGIDDLKSSRGFNKAVGPTKLGRFTPFKADVFSGDVDEFVAGVEFLTSGLTLEELQQAKANGTTFGALSKDEWVILAATATKIGTWKREREDGSIFYKAAEDDFMEELDKISNFAKLDALLKGADPQSINVQQQDDGSFWTKNGNGTFTELRGPNQSRI